MKKISFTLLALIAIYTASAQHRSTFDDLGLPANSFWNGSNLSGGFLDQDAYFTNDYDATYQSWSGFAYSNQPINVDTIYASAYDSSNDYLYQYNSAPGAGVNGSATFGICYTGSNPTLRLEGFGQHHEVYGMYVTNSAYDYISMKYGDDFAKKFGGVTGTDPDWFLLSITGWYQGIPIADTVNFYLADFRSSDTTQHYILNTWQFVDLLPLGNVDSLTFLLNSSDTGQFGMNTPAYFDLDNFMTTDGATYYPPIVVADSFRFQYLDTLTGNADTLIGNILANDTLSSFLQFTVSLITGPSIPGATAYLNAFDSLVYIPAAGIEGTDTLLYAVCDEVGSCDTAQIFVTILGPNDTGIKGVLSNPALHVYPNPASSMISLSYSSPMESVSVIDITGRQVMWQEVNSANTSMNIESLSPGAYTVVVHTSDGTAARSLVKN